MIPLAPSNCLTPRRLLATLSSLFVIIASSTDALAQGYATSTVDGAWSYLPVSPSRRAASSAIYDPVRDRMWIYSGRDPYWSALGEVWNLTLRASPNWQGIVPNGGVSAVWGAVPGYDGARDRFVLFSGANSAAPFDYDNGTRVLALAGSPTWVNLPSSGAVPLPRQGSAGFIDRARDRLVIFGGKTYDGSNWAYANDVRYQDLATGAWTLAAAAGTPPAGRWFHVAIYDSVRDRMVVFGGDTGSGASGEVWTLSFSGTPTWTIQPTTGVTPDTRVGAVAIYDGLRDRLLVGNANQMWALSLSDFSWTQLSFSGGPAARSFGATVYDPVADRMIVYGGTDPGGNGGTYDTWALSLSGTPTWNLLNAGRPLPRAYASLVRDPTRDHGILYGGLGSVDDGSPVFGDTWQLDLSVPQWRLLSPTGTAPEPEYDHTAIYDPDGDRMIVYGGTYSTVGQDLWSLSLAGTPAWSMLTASGSSPGGRHGHEAVYDPIRKRMLVYGGNPTDANVFALELTGSPAWSIVKTRGGQAPPPGFGFSAIYDPPRDRLLVLTGDTQFIWSLPLSGTPAWVELAVSGTPPGAGDWRAIYDSVRDRMVIYGSAGPDYQTGYTYALSLTGAPTWTGLNPSEPPSGRDAAASIYDTSRDRMVIFGGRYDGGVSVHVKFDDTDALDWGTTTAVLTSLVEVSAQADRVHIVWQESDLPRASVMRRGREGSWQARGTVDADGARRLTFDDLDVAPGDEYDYALAIEGGAGVLGAVHVTVPSRLGLRLEGARPNPAVGGGFPVAFALDRQAPGDLELLDLAGRRIDRVGLGSLPPGNHVLRLAAHQGLAPGVYLVRLRHAGRTLDCRAVMIH